MRNESNEQTKETNSEASGEPIRLSEVEAPVSKGTGSTGSPVPGGQPIPV